MATNCPRVLVQLAAILQKEIRPCNASIMIMHKNGSLQLQNSKGANGYVIPLGNSYAVIDPGMESGAKAVITELETAGILGEVSHVLLTHADMDHAGAALKVAAATGAVLWIGCADAEILTGKRAPGTLFRRLLSSIMLPKLPATYLLLGDSPGFPEEITAVATPGHTPGHFAFLWNQVLFCGDAVRVRSDGTLKQFFRPLITNTDQALASAAVLDALDFVWVCPGHGKVTQR